MIRLDVWYDLFVLGQKIVLQHLHPHLHLQERKKRDRTRMEVTEEDQVVEDEVAGDNQKRYRCTLYLNKVLWRGLIEDVSKWKFIEVLIYFVQVQD